LPLNALGTVLRDIAREAMDINAQMNAHMNETLNIGGALLVKLFGRTREEEKRFRERAANVCATLVFGALSSVRRSSSSLVGHCGRHGARLWSWRLLRHQGRFTVGTIVAFGSYLGQLYGSLARSRQRAR
jgi:ATP-binding cassette subfamily B protein